MADELNAGSVLAEKFLEKLKNKRFYSFSEFEEALRDYMNECSVVFVRCGSIKSNYHHLSFDRMIYCCNRRAPKPSTGRGIRRRFTRGLGCLARFNVRRKKNYLAVTAYNMEHNHKISKFLYDRFPVNRRLSYAELEQCKPLLQYNTPSSEVKRFVADTFGKLVTTKDVWNYRRKCKPVLISDLRSALTKLRECGRVLVAVDDEDCYSHICFARHQQIALFRRFPDVVNVDGTHGANRSGYKLYIFLITDGMGFGRPVMHAFVQNEHFASLRKLFSMFQEMMGQQYRVKTFVMDKMAAQMRAARVIYGCDILLCYFHVRQAIRRNTNSSRSRYIFHRMATMDNAEEFRRDLRLLGHIDPRFVSYLSAHWLYIRRKWAIHAQAGLVHFGNVTNNRLENANGRLKKETHHSDSLAHALQKVSRHSEWLMREYEMHTTYHCDRRELREGDSYVPHVIFRMTTYASTLVLRHLRSRVPTLRYTWVGECQVMKLFTIYYSSWFRVHGTLTSQTVDTAAGTCSCPFYQSMWLPCVHLLSVYRGHLFPYSRVPIHQRWLSEYNLPERGIPLSLVPQPSPSPLDALQSQINRLISKIRKLDPRKARAGMQSVIVHCNLVLHRGDPTTGPDVIQDTHPQPRWRSAAATRPCGLCGLQTVCDTVRWCPHDRLIYHPGCLDDQSCPYCGETLQSYPQAGPSHRQQTSNPTRVVKRPHCDVDIDRSVDEDRPRPKKRVLVQLQCPITETIGNHAALDERDSHDFE